MHVRVIGGTRAGWRKIRAAASAWRCRCVVAGERKLNRGGLVNCPGCGERRP